MNYELRELPRGPNRHLDLPRHYELVSRNESGEAIEVLHAPIEHLIAVVAAKLGYQATLTEFEKCSECGEVIDTNGWCGCSDSWPAHRRNASERPMTCIVCGAPIDNAELCEQCAKGNDPFFTSKYADSRHP